MKDLKIALFTDKTGMDTCISCKTFSGAWIYCPIFNRIMKEGVEFDETGELSRCDLFSDGLMWECKYCGENQYPQCHKCVREDGKLVSDELSRR